MARSGPCEKAALLKNLGAATAALHRVTTATAEETAAWRVFMAQQARNGVEHHRRHKLSERLLAQISDYIAPALNKIEAAPVVFLHSELMPEHVFVDPDRLTIQGLIDFEPSPRGTAEYDFGGVPIFMAQGNPHLLRAFLRGYGYRWNGSSPRLGMTSLLLHRCSNLGRFLELLGDRRPECISRLEELEQLRWTV